MSDKTSAGSAGRGLLTVDETSDARFDPQGSGGGWASGITQTRWVLLVRDSAGRYAIGSIVIDVTGESAFDRLDLPDLLLLSDAGAGGGYVLHDPPSADRIRQWVDLSGADGAMDQQASTAPELGEINGRAALALSSETVMVATPLDLTVSSLSAVTMGYVLQFSGPAPARGYIADQSPSQRGGSVGFGLRVEQGEVECFARSEATGPDAVWGCLDGFQAPGVPLPSEVLSGDEAVIVVVAKGPDGMDLWVEGRDYSGHSRAEYPAHDHLATSVGVNMVIGNSVQGTDTVGAHLGEALVMGSRISDPDREAWIADAKQRWGIA